MNWAVVIPLVLKISIVLSVVAVGLASSLKDATSLIHRPKELVRALVSMNVVMPIVAVSMVLLFDLHPAVQIALVALSVSPVPPFLPSKAMRAGGPRSYTVGILVAAALLSLMLLPLAAFVLGEVFHRRVVASPLAIAMVLGMTVVAPLGFGVLVRALAPRFAERAARPTSIGAAALLAASALAMLATSWHIVVQQIGDGTVVALIAFVVCGLAVGHFAAGPRPNERTVLALATATRHPGVAVAFAAANYPDLKRVIVATILLYALLAAAVSIPYLSRRGRATHRNPRWHVDVSTG